MFTIPWALILWVVGWFVLRTATPAASNGNWRMYTNLLPSLYSSLELCFASRLSPTATTVKNSLPVCFESWSCRDQQWNPPQCSIFLFRLNIVEKVNFPNSLVEPSRRTELLAAELFWPGHTPLSACWQFWFHQLPKYNFRISNSGYFKTVKVEMFSVVSSPVDVGSI